MSDKTLEFPIDKGTIYTRADGRSAEVLSIEQDRKVGIKGVNVRITQDGREPSFAFMHTADIATWQLQKPEVAPVGEQHAAPSVNAESPAQTNAQVIIELMEDLDRNAGLVDKLEAELGDAQRTITRLEKELEFSEARLDDITESRDSAIEHDAAAADRQIEVVAQLHTENDKLTEQLAEALAELASLKVNAPAAPAIDRTIAPKQEVHIERNVPGHYFAKMLNEGWEPLHTQFVPSGDPDREDPLNVVFARYCQPAPIAPEPLRASVKPVGPQVTIIPDASAVSPRFNAESYMANVLNECTQAAEEAVADQMEVYNRLLNPRPLILSANPVKPEVR